MIGIRVSSSESKALEQQAGASNDFQEFSGQGKGALKRKFSMDWEDKICDLYDLFVDELDGDAGPQVRKFYIELAGLWPSGSMDNHGIRRAIYRAAERRRALYNRIKERQRMRRKKRMAPKPDETSTRVEAAFIGQQQHTRKRVATDPTTAAANALPLDKTKQEKPKFNSSNPVEVAKKKVKRKPELDMNETHYVSASSEERNKSLKATQSLSQKLNSELPSRLSFQQSS